MAPVPIEVSSLVAVLGLLYVAIRIGSVFCKRFIIPENAFIICYRAIGARVSPNCVWLVCNLLKMTFLNNLVVWYWSWCV